MKLKSIAPLVLMISFIISCDPKPCNDPSNPACDNYDPCFGHNPVSADFDILESATYLPLNTPGFNIHQDTVWNNLAFFCPKDTFPGNNYTWYIGAETLDVKRFYRTNFPEHSLVNVKLVVTRNDTNCLNISEMKDSVSKNFYVLDQYDNLFNPTGDKPAWVGSYRGAYTSNPTDSFDFTLDYYDNTADSIQNLIFTGCVGKSASYPIYANNRAFHMPFGMEYYLPLSPNANNSYECMNMDSEKLNAYLPQGSKTLQVQWLDNNTNQWYYMSARKTD